MKLQYYRDHRWENRFISDAKRTVSLKIFKLFSIIEYYLILLQVVDIYRGTYAPTVEEINRQSSDSEDEFLDHISKRQRCDVIDEIAEYLQTGKASRTANILQWWKVTETFLL